MTKEEIKSIGIEEIRARKTEIESLIAEADTETIEALSEEVDALEERAKELKDEAEKKAEVRNKIANGEMNIEIVEERKEDKKMTDIEMRNTLEYQKAFIRGFKTNDYAECRALVSEAVSGYVPIPENLEKEVKTAWEAASFMQYAKKSNFKGDVTVVFEVSATDAVVHVEGQTRPDEEAVVLGKVTLSASVVKKWITVSDIAIENTTLETLQYIYKEIAHKIVAKAEAVAIANIIACGATTTTTNCGVPVSNANPALDTIVNAVSLLSAEAKDLHILMNRQTKAAFTALALNANYAVDVFDGLADRIIFTDALPAYSAASATDTYMIIGDIGYGYQANFPSGDDVRLITDEVSMAEYDVVKITGKQMIGQGVVAPKAFVKVCKVAEG